MRALAVVSGGMDSVTMAYELAADEALGGIISFDYGQRHAKELEYAKQNAELLGVPWHYVNLSQLELGGSALTDMSIEVPDGHYAEDNMKATVVPNRNAIMLSIATGYAVAGEFDAVATAVHGGDHYIYPDCRPEFIEALNRALQLATVGFASEDFTLLAPYLYITKADIAFHGHELKVPYHLTWSCYKGGLTHCGACGTCFERREAFKLARVVDPTVYEAQPEYEAPEGVS